MTPESWQDVFFTETNLDFLPHDMKRGKRNDQRKAICAYVGLCLTTTLGYWQGLDSEYVAPVHPVPRGEAPGMKVQLLKRGMENKEYAVIFAKGDEAFSGLQEFAGKYQIQSAHFTAIGALKGATLAWFDPSC